MARQFDVFVNPIRAARGAYPLVVMMQSDLAQHRLNPLVAPMVERRQLPTVAGRLTPVVEVDGVEHVVLVPALTGIRDGTLGPSVASLAASRNSLLAAVDYLFFGV